MGPNISPSATFVLVVAATEASSITITQPGGTTSVTTVPAGSAKRVTMPASVVVQTPTSAPVQQVVKVVSNKAITVYGYSWSAGTADSYLALPESAWGTSYMVVDLEAWSVQDFGPYDNYLLLVGGEADADISITTKVPTTLGAPGTYPLALPAQRAFMLTTTSDITGTLLSGTGPFGVIAGQKCAFVPNGCFTCATVFEWLPPLPSWGTTFLTTAFYQASTSYTPTCAIDSTFNLPGDLVKLVAAQDGTSFTLNGAPLVTLDAGQSRNLLLGAGTSAVIQASGPAQVLQAMTGSFHRNSAGGDPSAACECAAPPAAASCVHGT
jgi:hypothetical protein